MTAAVAYANPSLRARRLPKWAPGAVGAGAVLLSFLLFYVGGLLGGGMTLTVIAALVLFVIAISITSRAVEGPRAARNRVVTTLIYSACVLAAIPLVAVAYTLVHKGLERFDVTFFTHSNRNITAFDSQGGAYHAIIGTLEQAGIATLISVPLGILGAIYIVEYGRGRLASTIRFFVDVMTGIPSIVAGLFILSFWVLVVSPHFSATGLPTYSGFAAALALSVLMLPTVTRSTEEMLRLVPDSLREGSYALGIAEVEDDRQDRVADRDARHRHRRHAGGRPRRPARRRRCCWSPAPTTRSTSTRSRATRTRWPLHLRAGEPGVSSTARRVPGRRH